MYFIFNSHQVKKVWDQCPKASRDWHISWVSRYVVCKGCLGGWLLYTEKNSQESHSICLYMFLRRIQHCGAVPMFNCQWFYVLADQYINTSSKKISYND